LGPRGAGEVGGRELEESGEEVGGMARARTSAGVGRSVGREAMGRTARIQQSRSCLRGCRSFGVVVGVLSIRG
jgi:hypothetical protein